MKWPITEYELAKVNLVRAGCPAELLGTVENRALNTPIVIEKNRDKLGYVKEARYYPPAIIVAGAARRTKILETGTISAWAWVERGALELNGDTINSEQLLSQLNSLVTKKICGSEQPLPGQQKPLVTEVHPFENYLVFHLRGQRYKQQYGIAGKELALMTATIIKEPIQACTESMQRVENGIRYAYAPVKGNSQTSTTGGKTSELVTMVVRSWTNINEAVRMYLSAVKYGLRSPMTPAFQPVKLSDTGKVISALASNGIEPLDFAIWTLAEQKEGRTKSHEGNRIPMKQFAFVGDSKDKSTWYLPLDSPVHIKSALAQVDRTKGIPQEKKSQVLKRVVKAAETAGVTISRKPGTGQKKWVA